MIAEDDGLTVSVDNIIAALTGRTKLIFLANPNNPTGTMISKAEIEKLIAAVPKNVIIVLDSAYANMFPPKMILTPAALNMLKLMTM